MKAKQYLLIAVALVLVVVLAMLPKAVLKKEGDQPAESSRGKQDTSAMARANAGGGAEAVDAKAEQSHAKTLTPNLQAKITAWRSKWTGTRTSARADKQKLEAAAWTIDSMAATFVVVGLYDSAAAYREQYARLVPSAINQQLAGDVSFDAYTLALNEDKRARYLKASRQWYELALKTDPKNLDSKAKLALTYVDSDNPMQGILMLREVVTANPKHELATYNLGVFAMQTKQWDKAVTRFTQLTVINPASTKAYFYLGVSYKELGDKPKAIAALRQARSLDKDPAVIASIDEVLEELQSPAAQ